MTRLMLICLFLFSGAAFAWQLQPDVSTLNFISVKKGSVGEVHRFTQLQGAIDPAGVATLTIVLAGVDTGIEVRDQRMRDMLFEVAQFPTASVRAGIDGKALAALKPGEQIVQSIKGELTLHGKAAPLNFDAIVTKLADGRISVISQHPAIVNAEAFDLVAGIAKLAEAANLPSISTAVPVTFVLLFMPEAADKTLQPPSGLRVQ